MTTPAFAQVAPAPASAADSGGDIVVTARRQSERLLDVPLAITALPAETLREAGVEKLSDAAALTAGLLIAKTSSEASGGNPLGGSGVLRGIVDVSGSGTPTVGTFFNGVYLPNGNAVSVGIIAMERIEIVKGPVSALYGRGAFAGAINYVLKQPGQEWSGHLTGEVGNGRKRAVSGEISGAIIPDILSIGFAGAYDDFDGTYQDKVNGLHAGGHKKRDGRVSFLLTPSEPLKIYGGYYYGHDDFNYAPQAHQNNNCGAFTAGALVPGTQFAAFCGKVVVTNPVEVANISQSAGQSANSRRVQIGDFHVNYDFGFAKADMILGYNKVKQVGFQDFSTYRDGLPFALIPGPGVVTLYELFGGGNNNRDYSGELRLSSRQDQRIRWAIGAYRSTEKSSTSTLIGIDRSRLPTGQSINGTAALFLTSNGQFSTTNLTLTNNTDKQTSPFASVEFDIVPALTVFGEVRHVDQSKSQDILRNSFITNTVRPYGPAVSGKFKFTNYRAGARYKVTPDTVLYATVATGEKAGGFNQRATIASELKYNPEKNITYELGVKTDLFEHRLQLNTAAYYIKDSDLQVSGPSDDPTNVGFVTKNFGGFTSKGFEIEARGVVNRMITLTGALSYNDAKFSKSAFNFSPPAVCNFLPSCKARLTTVTIGGLPRTAESLDGYQVPYTSKWIANAGVNFKGDIGDALKWFARAEYRYEARLFNTIDNYNYVGPRNNVDLSAGLTHGAISGLLYVDNVTNNQTPNYASPFTRLNDFGVTWVANLPDARQYGIRLTVGF